MAARRRPVPAGVLLALTVLCAAAEPALAQDHPLGLRLRSTVLWDGNVFRLPAEAADPQSARGISGKADRIATSLVGLVLDKAYAQQRVQLELTQTAIRYDKFSTLNRDAFEYRGNWRWHLTPRISGSVSASRSESLVSFEDEQVVQRIVRVTSNRGATVDGWLFGGWHLLAGVSETTTTSSGQAALAVPDSSQTSGHLGFKYESASLNSISLTRRSSQGTNVAQAGAFAGGAFTQRETELAAAWAVSAKSAFNGRLTGVERRNENLPERDFSGVSGEVRYAWTPTAKLSLSASAARSLAPYFAAGSTYRVEDAVSIAPTWRLAPKVTLRARLDRREQAYRGAAAVSGTERRDVLRGVELAADWAAHPRLSLSATLRRDRRDSTDAASKFAATTASLTAAANF